MLLFKEEGKTLFEGCPAALAIFDDMCMQQT
jgi:hypothetical protein